MTDDEAAAILPEAQAYVERAWDKAGMDDLGKPAVAIVPKYASQIDPGITHNASLTVAVRGRPHELRYPIENGNWRRACGGLVYLFANPRPLVRNVETGDYQFGKSFRQRVTEGLS